MMMMMIIIIIIIIIIKNLIKRIEFLRGGWHFYYCLVCFPFLRHTVP
jgi:hypothetical protein